MRRTLARLRPSPSMAVAILALFVALGGVGYAAATGSIDSRELKNNSVRSKDVRNGSLLKKDFRSGQLPAGARGPQGAPGQAGIPGSTGAAAASMIIGGSDVPLSTAENCFCNNFPPSGFLKSGTAGATDDFFATTPNVPLVLRDLHVEINQDPGGTGRVRTFELVNDALAPLLACTIATPGTSCDSAGPVSIPGGTELMLRAKTGSVSPALATRTQWAFRATAP